MNVSRQRLHVLERRRRQNTVTEVEDVAGTSARAREHFVGGGKHPAERPDKQRRLGVSRNGAGEPNPRPSPLDRRRPAGPNHATAGAAPVGKNGPGPTAELNSGQAKWR